MIWCLIPLNVLARSKTLPALRILTTFLNSLSEKVTLLCFSNCVLRLDSNDFSSGILTGECPKVANCFSKAFSNCCSLSKMTVASFF